MLQAGRSRPAPEAQKDPTAAEEKCVSSRMAALRAQTLQSEDLEDSRWSRRSLNPGTRWREERAPRIRTGGRRPARACGAAEASPASRSLQTPCPLVEAQTPAARLVEAHTPPVRLLEAPPPARLVPASGPSARLVETRPCCALPSTRRPSRRPWPCHAVGAAGGKARARSCPGTPAARILAELNRIPSSRRRAARLFEWLIAPMPLTISTGACGARGGWCGGRTRATTRVFQPPTSTPYCATRRCNSGSTWTPRATSMGGAET